MSESKAIDDHSLLTKEEDKHDALARRLLNGLDKIGEKECQLCKQVRNAWYKEELLQFLDALNDDDPEAPKAAESESSNAMEADDGDAMGQKA